MMRFKRVERTIEKLPGWNMLVEDILTAENEPPATPEKDTVIRMKPMLRLVKTAPREDGG